MDEDKISVDEAMESLEEEQAEEEKAELSKEEFEANLKKLEENKKARIKGMVKTKINILQVAISEL